MSAVIHAFLHTHQLLSMLNHLLDCCQLLNEHPSVQLVSCLLELGITLNTEGVTWQE